MASPLIIAALAASMAILPPLAATPGDVVAMAGDCSSAAAKVVSDTGGQLLSAQPSGDSCVIIVLIQGNGNERPRKLRVKVPM